MHKHLGTKTLYTDRLILRKFNVDDAKAMFYGWAIDDDVTKYLTWNAHKNVTETTTIISEWIRQYSNPKFYQWAVTLQDNTIIGSISLIQVDDNDLFEVGYCFAKRYWHNGYASESLQKVINFAFNDVGLFKLIGKHHILNTNSGKVLTKCGMKYIKNEVVDIPLKNAKFECLVYEIENHILTK